ncbi:MAG: glycosyltransferase family 4 protein [Anaerolineae bacterium]|nr:glycosyltransferase family 4 protein [Anaerolineae bacterium]
MKVLMMVQQLDETHWLRGFTVGWVRALAAEVEHLHVLTLEDGPATLPANVTVASMGKEQGHGRAKQLAAYYRTLARVVPRVDWLFSHMTPRYTWLATPLAQLHRKPQMLWFTHRQVSTELRLALAAARWVSTASPQSFPLAHRKVQVLGHGIDATQFAPDPFTPLDQPPLVLAVGRITPIKHHHVLLQAAALLRDQHGDPPVQFAVAGAPAALVMPNT